MTKQTVRCTDIDRATRKMFANRLKGEQIPPTFDALEHYQDDYVWVQSVLPSPGG